MSQLTSMPHWKDLQRHQQEIAAQQMSTWFVQDSKRNSRFSVDVAGILLNYAKNRINQQTQTLLLNFASQRQLLAAIDALFAGEQINQSEQRAAMHMALRNHSVAPLYVSGKDVMCAVRETLTQMGNIVEQVRQHQFLGFAEQPIDTIINIGIGGSDLGPQLLLSALQPYVDTSLNYYFFNTYDHWQIQQTLAHLNPATTLVIIASKSFTTEETLVNAALVKEWQLTAAPNLAMAQRHWIAVTAEVERAIEFDILPEHVFKIWDWVGGRYSIWSAVGLMAAFALGMSQFNQFLAGGYALDQHFRYTEFSHNMPVIMALLELWYQQFFAASTRAILPYGLRLRLFPDYMQQLHMESLGKRVDQSGEVVDYKTGNIIWGGVGTNSQHSFHQLLLQGTEFVPVDFILACNESADNDHYLLSHCLAQSQVLMQGYHKNDTANSQQSSKQDTDTVDCLPHQVIPGNSPSNLLLLKDLSPYRLGALIALYEHKVFAYAALLGINPFDQWGVERGKQIARHIRANLHAGDNSCYDASTQEVLEWIQRSK